MSEKELNAIIAENITRLLETSGKTQDELADFLGVTQSTISYWCKGVKTPRMTKIDKICEFFGVKRSEVIGDPEDGYYFNDDTAEIAQAIKDSEELRLLFDESRDAPPEDIKVLYDMLLALKRKEQS